MITMPPSAKQGRATPKYYALRALIQQYSTQPLPEPPPPVPVMTIPAFTLQPYTSLWDHLPRQKARPSPCPWNTLIKKSGMILYRTRLIGHKSGNLTITEPHDYALVFLNGLFIDTVFRDGGNWTVKLPKTEVKDPVLEILVESMGHINFAQYLIDRKGITDRVTLNGMTLMNWEIFNLPLTGPPTTSAPASPALSRGVFFKGGFDLDSTADTYLDLSAFKKGVRLGQRPQSRPILVCRSPATFVLPRILAKKRKERGHRARPPSTTTSFHSGFDDPVLMA